MPTATLGPIDPHTLYPLPDFMARAGLGNAAMRSARRRGLKLRQVGSRKYVHGGEFIRWLEQQPDADAELGSC